MIWASKTYKKSTNKSGGFTIVELLIVVFVIAILAAITTFAYNGAQAQSRNAIRLQHGKQIADAVAAYAVKHGDVIGYGHGVGRIGWGIGWFNKGGVHDPMSEDVDPAYTKSILDLLIEEKLLDETVLDPSGTSAFPAAQQEGQYAYMKYHCGDYTDTKPKTAYIFFKLEGVSEADRMPDDKFCPDETNIINLQTAYNNYGMTNWIKVEI